MSETDVNDIKTELNKLNTNLEELLKKKIFECNTKGTFQNIIDKFLSGFAQTMGALIGYFIVLAVGIYLVTKFDLQKVAANWVQDMMMQINWNKIVMQQSSQITPPQGIDLENIIQKLK